MAMDIGEAKDKAEKILEDILAPGEMKELVVGLYENAIPTPRLQLELASGDSKGVEIELTKVDDYGDYFLIYSLKNRSDKAFSVTVAEGA